MAAPSKRARKKRTKDEFDLSALAAAFTPPKDAPDAYSWTLADIVTARNEQMRGRFKLPAEMAKSMRTDAAIAVPWRNRLAVPRCLGVELVPAKGARGVSIANEAEGLFGNEGIAITPDGVADIQDCLVDHNLAVAQCTPKVRDDGSRIDLLISPWPIKYVRWDATECVLKTQTSEGFEQPIVHGDGRWLVFKQHEIDPWAKGAAILDACLVWCRHAMASSHWMRGSLAHASAKVLAELPLGVALKGKDGKMTNEAKALMELLRLIQSADSPFGIKPAGSKIDMLSNTGQMWQIWDTLTANAERWGARIYTGTDAMLGSKGGAPGVDITALFGVLTTLVQGDVGALQRGFATAIEVWCALNFGDSTLAPRRRYRMPDPDAAMRVEVVSKRRTAFFTDIELTRKNGFVVTEDYVAATAKEYELDEPPALPPVTSTKAPTIQLAPTDIARVVTVNEARAAAGCDPLKLEDGTPDPDGRLTVEQFALKKAAEVQAPPAASPAAA